MTKEKSLRDYLLNSKFTDKPDFTKGEGLTPIMFKEGDKIEITRIDKDGKVINVFKKTIGEKKKDGSKT
jgi:hypothetical protein